MADDRVMLIDGTNLFMRAMFAARSPKRPWTSSCFTILVSMISKYVGAHRPTHLIVTWDSDGPTWRKTNTYSSDRDSKQRLDREADRELERQAKTLLHLLGLPVIGIEGYESDDLIGSFWRAYHQDNDVLIVSSDKDFLQLLGERTIQMRPGHPQEVWTAERVAQMYVQPKSMVLYLALVGDAADQIKGVQGIGVKTAKKLLSEGESHVEELLQRFNSLRDAEDILLRNFALINLRSPVRELDALVGSVPRFNPVDGTEHPGFPALLEFLNDHDGSGIAAMVSSGRMWK